MTREHRASSLILSPEPYTLHPLPYTLCPLPCTLFFIQVRYEEAMTRGAQTKRRKNAAGDNITISCGNKAVRGVSCSGKGLTGLVPRHQTLGLKNLVQRPGAICAGDVCLWFQKDDVYMFSRMTYMCCVFRKITYIYDTCWQIHEARFTKYDLQMLADPRGAQNEVESVE